jgi:hypothetical protein
MNLTDLALKFGSDKAGHHSYTEIYERYFEPLRYKPLLLVELGIGGYEFPDRGGASLKMWYEYFPNAFIIGIDLNDKIGMSNARTQIFKCSQDDEALLKAIVSPAPDIIIDDASHICPLTIRSFEILWPRLKSGGIYVVEDIEGSWCPGDGWAKGCADHKNYDYPSTINYFRHLCDELNAQYIPHYTAGNYSDIESIHFYKNIIFLIKK